MTSANCGHCTRFLTGPWPSLKEGLSYGIGGGSVEHVDLIRDGAAKVPASIPKLQFVPWVFAVHGNDTVEALKIPPNTSEGLKELAEWATRGPPKYASIIDSGDATAVADSDDDMVNPRLEVVAITSSSCPHCKIWEASGDLKKFLDSIPTSVNKSHYNVPDEAPTTADDMRRRTALVGVKVPSVIFVNSAKWKQPVSRGLQPKDITLFPYNVRIPSGLTAFKQWQTVLQDQKTPFLGYLVVSTSPTCGYCVRWKESGRMDQFLEAGKNLPGILLLHNGPIPDPIKRPIPGYPSIIFVPSSEWSSPNPEVSQGPNPLADPDGLDRWMKQLQKSEGQWSNNPKFIPQEYQQAAAAREPRRSAATLLASRKPPRRQALR